MPSAHSTRNVGAGYRLLPGSHPAQMTVTRWHLRRRKLREHARKSGAAGFVGVAIRIAPVNHGAHAQADDPRAMRYPAARNRGCSSRGPHAETFPCGSITTLEPLRLSVCT
jgi:hypothetical protein